MKSTLRGEDEIAAAVGGFIQPKTLFSTSSAFGGLHREATSSRSALARRDFILFPLPHCNFSSVMIY
jgi:hypothetical protein